MMMEFDFTENMTVESLDAVPEKYRGLYGEAEGGFKILDTVSGLVSDYVGTNKSLSQARADKKKASDESAARRLALKSFEDVASGLGLEPGDEGYAPALQSHIEELTGKVKGGEALKVNLDKVKADYDKRLSENLATKDEELGAMSSALNKHLVESTAKTAIAKHGGSEELLLPHIKSMCAVVKDENGEYSVRVKDEQGDYKMDGAGGFMGVEGAVEELKKRDTFKPAFKSEEKSGMGTQPGSMTRKTSTVKNPDELSAVDKITQGLQQQSNYSR